MTISIDLWRLPIEWDDTSQAAVLRLFIFVSNSKQNDRRASEKNPMGDVVVVSGGAVLAGHDWKQRLAQFPNTDDSNDRIAIVRSIVEKHGGRVVAESKGEGKGSTFFVRLPRI